MTEMGETESQTNCWEAKNFKPLVDFVFCYQNSLIGAPLGGEFYKLANLFDQHFFKKHKHRFLPAGSAKFEVFKSYMDDFNKISGEALKFESGRQVRAVVRLGTAAMINLQLTSIDMSKLLILNDRLSGFPAKELKFKGVSSNDEQPGRADTVSILDILNQPLFSEICPDFTNNSVYDSGFCSSFRVLQESLEKSTARIELAKEKARMKLSSEVFHQVCDDSAHSNVISNLCLNRKDVMAQAVGKQNFPPHEIVHNKINQLRHLMSQDLFKCTQSKAHFIPILNNYTDLSLGDCSYLDTCHKMKSCRYLHYYTLVPSEINQNSRVNKNYADHDYTIGDCFTEHSRKILPPQWINCDVRYLPFSVLGKFAVIISDPAWDIHMSLPYGTCKDFELLSLPMYELQDEGILLLWVTGRSIEIGRKALIKWGYSISDEVIWVKLNQLKRTIVTGRTGHWLNHSKEHLLVGIKGNPQWINKKIDIDVVVSGTRETSRKPDEIYDIIERMVGVHARKLEIFGRDHNVRPGWLTIGNQLMGTSLYEKEVKTKYDDYMKVKKVDQTLISK